MKIERETRFRTILGTHLVLVTLSLSSFFFIIKQRMKIEWPIPNEKNAEFPQIKFAFLESSCKITRFHAQDFFSEMC